MPGHHTRLNGDVGRKGRGLDEPALRTPIPPGEEGTHPSGISCVWNVAQTPMGRPRGTGEVSGPSREGPNPQWAKDASRSEGCQPKGNGKAEPGR